MGKIRSTLDIVMERTRDMSMSQEDKDRLKEKELADKARAWAQKYLDGKATWKDIRTRLDSAGEDGPKLSALLKTELVSNVRLGRDNSRLIDALDGLSGAGRDRISGLISDHEREVGARMARHLELLRLQLEAGGIRGSSVTPNAEKDPSWHNAAREVEEHLRARLADIL